MVAEASRSGTARNDNGSRLGGARADFVASLGRKVADLRTSLGHATKGDEGASWQAFERKLRALGAGAKLLKFDAMETAIGEAIALIVRAEGRLSEVDVASLGQTLDDLPALAWSQESPASARPSGIERTAAATYSAMVVGPALVAEALLDATDGGPTFACQSTPDAQAAFDLACMMEPDLLVIDADLDDTLELIDALMDDRRTESVPVVVVGSFLEPGDEARYIALGVAKTIGKPTSREALRHACLDALEPPRPTIVSKLSGEPTLDELGERIATEFRQALVDGASFQSRGERIPLGEGTEVVTAVWSAIARVREIVMARTGGAVRFPSKGPEGAIPLALIGEGDVARADRARAHARGTASEVRLQGRRVVVADDDPAVVWFMSDLLRTAGCVVHEALDGRKALELAYSTTPDVVISDILMPELDGFSLCRALRRDIALRDVPVILLSWKEDLLQRVRELGAGAAGYVRKESDANAILARVRESLRPRARLEARLREEGRIRGRLDDMSVRTVLELACAMRPDARISVRDASFLYEVEIRNGAPVRVTRACGDGRFERGREVLATLLGVRGGSFVVAPSTELVDVDLDGSLDAQLAAPMAHARAAASLLLESNSGSGTVRLVFDEAGLADYVAAMPHGPRALTRRLRDGVCPRTLVLDGADPSVVSDLLCDLVGRGLVRRIEDVGGIDLLDAEKARQLGTVEGDVPSEAHAPEAKLATLALGSEALTDDAEAPDESCAVDPAALCASPTPGFVVAAALAENSAPAPVVALGDTTLVDNTTYGEVSTPIDEPSAPVDLEGRDHGPVERSPESERADEEAIESSVDCMHDTSSQSDVSSSEVDAPSVPVVAVSMDADDAEARALAAVPSKADSRWLIAFVVAVMGLAWAVMHFAHIDL